MQYVYLLQHTYLLGKDDEYEETKIIGIYDDKLKAQNAIKKYSQLPGFKDFSDDCFTIDKYELNVGEWGEGFTE